MDTRILVTLGPSSMKGEIIGAIAEQSVHLFRINMSHTAIESLERVITEIKKHTDVPICLDSEGAQIRNGAMKNGVVTFQEGETVKIHRSEIEGDSNNISFYPPYVWKDLRVGDVIRIDFDSVCVRVIEKNREYHLAHVETGGLVGSRKAVNVNREMELEPISEKDRQAIAIGRDMGIRNFALSFANSKNDVELMGGLVGPESSIISKIESRRGLLNLNEIMEASDAILIDRGDLSREVHITHIPFLQRKIISAARSRETPVYVATNLLESMVTTRTPTRAEVNDVVSTLLMGADGLVLAAETAVGRFPVESVAMIRDVIERVRMWKSDLTIEEILQIWS